MDPKQQTPPATPLQQLRGYLIENDYDVPQNEADFPTWVQEEGRLTRLHKLLLDDKEGAEVTPDFDTFQQELLGANTKKKPTSLETGPTGSLPAGGGAAVEPDQEFISVPDLAPAPSPIQPAQAVAPGLQEATPFAPGSAAAPLAANLPNLETGTPGDLRAPAAEEADYLGKLPAFQGGPEVPDGKERVAIPNEYTGAVPAGSYQLKLGGEGDRTQYFDRDLSKLVDGKEQSVWDAATKNFGNQLLNMGKGGADYLAAADRRLRDTPLGRAADKVGGMFFLNDDPARGVPFQEAAEGLESLKGKIAPFHEKSQFRVDNPATWPMATSNAAALAAPMVLSALLPESKIAGVAQKLLAVGFDGQILEGSVERAKAAGLTGAQADNFVLADGAASMLVFKLGGAGLNAAGQKLLQSEMGQGIAAALKDRVAPLTQAELNDVLTTSAARLAPILRQAGVGAASGGILFGANEAKNIVAERVTNAAMGREAFPNQSLPEMAWRVGGAAGEGALITGLQGAATAIGAPAPPSVVESPTPINDKLYDLHRATGQVELSGVQIIRWEEGSPTATVRGQDGQGNPVERDVPAGQLFEQARPASPALAASPEATALPEPAAENLPAAVPIRGTKGLSAALDATGQVSRLIGPDGAAYDPAALYKANPGLEEVVARSLKSPQPAAEVTAPASEAEVASQAPALSQPPVSLPAAEPHPEHVKPLTAAQQATNNTLDALDRYNALDTRAKKGKEGSTIRAEIADAGRKAGLSVAVKGDFSMSVTRDGKRATRYNEYTATTPAASHVPLAKRPAEARPFLDSVLTQAEARPQAIQGMGIKLRGKELSARELTGAVEDIKSGRNTLRAQMVLDNLENAYRRGYVEKSEGSGITTRKFTVPVQDYIGDAPQPTASERALSDGELDELAAQDPSFLAALDSYTNPETGEIDYARLADHGTRGALETFFDVTPEVAAKVVALANERANQPAPAQLAASEQAVNGSAAQGRPQPNSPATGGAESTPTTREVALAQAPDNPAEATGERAHAKRYTDETQASLTQEERNYVPSAAKIAANESPADFIKRAGPEAAYEAAVGEPTTEALLHDNLVRGVAEHYTEARNTALKVGDTAAADAAQERVMRLVGALSKRGTEQAQALQARTGAAGAVSDLLSAKDPAATGRATIDAALGEIANRNAEAQRQNATDAAEIEAQAKPKRERKMSEVLATKTVKAAIEKAAGTSTPPTGAAPADKTGYGEHNKFFTKSKVAEWRKQLRTMAFSAPLPAESILLGAYHLEASTRKFADWSAKMLREVGARIRPRLPELYALSTAELLKKDPTASGFNTPEEVAAIVGRQQAPGAVREGVSALDKRLSDIARQHASDTNTDRRTLTRKFIEDAGLSGRAAGEVAAAIEREWTQRVEKASWQVLRGRFQPKRTRAKLDALSRLVNDLNAAGNLPESTLRSPVAQLLEQLIGNSVPVSAAEAQHIEALKDAYVKAAKKTARNIGGVTVETQDTKAVAKAALDMLGAIGRLKNVGEQDWAQDVGAMFYASILSNPSTHAANAYLNTIATGHEVGLISTIHTAADAGLLQAAKPLLALFPGYKRGAANAYDVATTGVDLKSKVGDALSDKDFQADPLEESSVVRGRLLAGLQKLGIGRNWQAPEKSAARVVRRALGASDTFFQGGLAEARAKEIAVKLAVRAVERRQASGGAMTGREVRQFIADETDRILFNTPAAIADIKAIVASEGLGSPKTVAEVAARHARIGDLLDQARAAASPELVADVKEFAARHAGNSEYEGHLGRFAYALADTFKGLPVVGKIIVPFAKVTSNFQNRYAEWTGLGFYRAVQGGAGKPLLGKFGEIDKRFVREYTPEEQEKAFLRSTIGTLVGMSSYALVKAGYIAITGMASGNKDEDQQRPAQSIILLKGPLAGTSFSYKGMNEEIALSTLAQTMAWAKKKHLADDDPDVADRLEAVALITTASTLNLGPSNGAGDFLGTISKVSQNPEAWFKAVERMGTTGAKAMLMPAGVTYATNLLNQATDANLPQKQSTDAWQQFKLQVWGDVPSYLGGPDKQDALDSFGDPMKYASNRFWGTQPISDDPRKAAAKLLLVDKGLMPDEIRMGDRRLRLYDPVSGDKATPLTSKEYRDFCEARGKAFYRELSSDEGARLNEIREASTPKAAAKVRNQALTIATDEARALIESRRAANGAAAEFKAR